MSTAKSPGLTAERSQSWGGWKDESRKRRHPEFDRCAFQQPACTMETRTPQEDPELKN